MRYIPPSSVYFTVYLSAAAALGPLSTDMYLPTFPELARVFHASAAEVQLTLSAFTLTVGLCQLLYGPLTDRLGRKYLIFFGLLLYIAASIGCATAESIYHLIFFRVVQAIGICGCVIIPRAIVRDVFEREEAAARLSLMGAIVGLAPALAPIIGGHVAVYFGWHAIFAVLGAVALTMALVTLFMIAETIPARDPGALNPRSILGNYAALLVHREFLGFAFAAGISFAGLFAFISGSPLVLIKVFGVASHHFGYFYGAVILGFMGGSLIGRTLTARHNLYVSVRLGTLIVAAGGISIMILAFAGIDYVAAVVGPMILYSFGLGIVLPQSQAGAMAPFPEKAGAASALVGFIMLGLAAFVGYLVAFFYDGTQMSMCIAIGVLGLCAALCYRAALGKRYEQEEEEPAG